MSKKKKRLFAISDIHGCANTFKALLQKIEFSPSDKLYLLGDFIDRGPDSKGVFDYIFSLQEQGHQIYCLRGNHEAMLFRSTTGIAKSSVWRSNGGEETLQSFGADSLLDIPKRYRDFIAAMPYFLEVNEYLLVHAGFNFSNAPEKILEDKESMLWVRHWYQNINKTWLGDRIIIHGHTPISKQKIKQQARDFSTTPALDIDAGCVHIKKGSMYGNLCAFEMKSRQLYFQKYVEDS